MRKAFLLMGLGFLLVFKGLFVSAFWYANQEAEPFLLWDGLRIFPGTLERVVGLACLTAGMIVAFRAK